MDNFGIRWTFSPTDLRITERNGSNVWRGIVAQRQFDQITPVPPVPSANPEYMALRWQPWRVTQVN